MRTGANLRILNCVITGNRVEGNVFNSGGGGVFFFQAGSIRVVNCRITHNEAFNGGGVYATEGGFGGYALVTGDVTNCLIADNDATLGTFGNGGGVFVDGSNLDYTNCTFADNVADQRGGGVYSNNLDRQEDDTYTNCILWGNTTTLGTDTVEEEQVFQEDPFFSPIVVTYCCIQDDDPDDSSIPFDGPDTFNIDDDPEFLDAGLDNYRLSASPCSPAVDAGNTEDVPADTHDVDGYADTGERTPDLDLNIRIIDGEADMGAYESPPDGCNLAADVDGDGCVKVDDLVAVILAWGSCLDCEDCDADVTGDCVVDVDDLVAVVLSWEAGCGSPPLSLQDEVEASGLTWQDWENFDADDENERCWMAHYLASCHPFCTNPPDCPDDDPWGNH